VTRAAKPGFGGVRLLVALAALTPWLATSRPLLELRGGSLRSPALAASGGEELFWGALLFAELLRLAWPRRGLRVVVGVAGLVLLVLALLPSAGARGGGEPASFAVAAPVPWDPGAADWELLAQRETTLPAPPSARHWLGTDATGRDLLARLLHGLRTSLSVGVAAAALALGIGVAVGAACGTLRGVFDLLAMRAIEVLLCLPGLFTVIVVFAYLPRERAILIALLGLLSWTGIARLVRGEFLRLAGEEFVLASRALGASRFEVAWRHLLPNALAPVWAAATFAVANALLAEFSLSWLGFGVPEPQASLGTLLAEGQRLLTRGRPLPALAPSLLIVAIVLAFHRLGERLRVATTPEGELLGREAAR